MAAKRTTTTRSWPRSWRKSAESTTKTSPVQMGPIRTQATCPQKP